MVMLWVSWVSADSSESLSDVKVKVPAAGSAEYVRVSVVLEFVVSPPFLHDHVVGDVDSHIQPVPLIELGFFPVGKVRVRVMLFAAFAPEFSNKKGMEPGHSARRLVAVFDVVRFVLCGCASRMW